MIFCSHFWLTMKFLFIKPNKIQEKKFFAHNQNQKKMGITMKRKSIKFFALKKTTKNQKKIHIAKNFFLTLKKKSSKIIIFFNSR